MGQPTWWSSSLRSRAGPEVGNPKAERHPHLRPPRTVSKSARLGNEIRCSSFSLNP
jgi:hypothetical protein